MINIIQSHMVCMYVYILTHSLVKFWSVVLSKCYPDVCYNICNEVYVWLITTNALLFIIYNARMHIFKINNIVKNLIVLQPVCYNLQLQSYKWMIVKQINMYFAYRSLVHFFLLWAQTIFSHKSLQPNLWQWIETQTNIKHINDYPNQDIEAIHELSF